MPIPTYEGRRTYFFFADVEPKELMTFGVEPGIQLDDDSTLEVLGHALAYWAIAEEQEVLTLRAFVQDVFDVTLAIYALIRLDRGDRRDALRLRAELHSWLEVRGVEARANVVGTIHERYEAGAVTELDGPRARDFTTAAHAAWRSSASRRCGSRSRISVSASATAATTPSSTPTGPWRTRAASMRTRSRRRRRHPSGRRFTPRSGRARGNSHRSRTPRRRSATATRRAPLSPPLA